MAALQKRNASFRVLFRHHGKQYSFTLGVVPQNEAEAKAAQVDYLLMRLKQRLLVLPEEMDIVTFVEHDGNPPATTILLPNSPRQAVTLGHLKDRWLETHANGTIEANSLDTCRTRLTHFCRVLGDARPVGELSHPRLQEYVNRRARDRISPDTIRQEISTLGASWNWGELNGLTIGKFPNKGLRYPKRDEKPPFMNRDQILRQIAAGGAAKVLWNSLYLQTDELAELLAHVKKDEIFPWIYPLFCFAAHTGARRSEIIRALVPDVDFTGNVITIREKKRTRGERSSRRVPLTPFLRNVLQDWLKVHPGGSYLFCHAGEVPRSKKRSPKTGYQSGENRPSSLKGRMLTVKKRKQLDLTALTRNEVHHHFKKTLEGSKWGVIRGLHTLRHSFISACASKGVDQRLVQEWCGHMNEATSRRYRHLWPSTQQAAIDSVFE